MVEKDVHLAAARRAEERADLIYWLHVLKGARYRAEIIGETGGRQGRGGEGRCIIISCIIIRCM